ncbi:MAG: hypothetical protein D6692_05440, partial [Planctomycetota bacterium]
MTPKQIGRALTAGAKNWKTTALGLILAAAIGITNSDESPTWAVQGAQVVQMIAAMLLGFL